MSVIALDLDRTLIYSAAALGLGEATAPLVVAERDDGEPLSYLTAGAASRLRALAVSTVVVPTTTRTLTQYRRVRVPGWSPRFAVTSNGGQLLVDGVPDASWAAAVHDKLRSAAPLAAVQAYLSGHVDYAWLLRRRVAEDLFCYLVVDRARMPSAFVAELAAWCAPRGWSASVQGRKVYCVPRGLTKRAAVGEVLRRVGGTEYLAAGDSLLDAELLDGAAAGVRPAHGELAETGWRRPHIETAQGRGVLAGEEIVSRLARLARRQLAEQAPHRPQ